MECAPGTGGLWEDGRWSRVVVRARAPKGVFRGEVEVQGREPDGARSPEVFSKRFEVSAEPQTIEVPVLPRDWARAVVTFRGEGIPPESREVRVDASRDSEFRILLIRDHPQPLGAISRAAEDWLGLKSGQTAVGYLDPRDLPQHFLGYEAADLVVIHRTALPDADPERLEALLEWVRRGGTVAAVRGPEWAGKLPGKLRELFGDEAAAPPGAGEAEIRIEKAFGSGRVFVLDPPSGQDILVLRPPGPAWRRIVERSARFRISPSVSPAGIEAAAIEALVWFSGFHYPSRTKVLLLVLAYLGIGFFLAGALFGRKKKLERMYIFALGLAVLAGAGIWRYGLLASIREASVDEVTLAVVRPGSTLADAMSFVGVASPGQSTLRPRTSSFAGTAIPSQPAGPDRPDRPRGRELPPLTYRISGPSVEVPEVLVYANSTRLLRFDHPADLGGKITTRIVRRPDGSRGLRVSNSTRLDLGRLILFEASMVYELASLGAGEEKEFPLENPAAAGLYEEELGGRASISDEAEARQHNLSAVKSSLARLGRGSCRLLAETEEPIFPAGVLGPIRHSLNVLVLEVEAEDGR